jgi:acyl-CoA synthetase (NDP forming)
MEPWTADQMKSIGRMLNPRSIAIVGASAKGGGYGARLLNAVLKSKDRIPVYPVNPNHAEIMGVPAYRSVSDLPQAPDLVGVVVPYHQVLPVLEECHRKGAGSAVVISAGFAERGDDTRLDLERRLAAFTRESGLRIAGPNCLGVANVRDNIWATASSRTLGGLTGPIGLICQSGATAFGPFLMRAVDGGIGLSHIISTGNETDLDFSDFARYLLDDPGTRVIAGFVEGFKNFGKFIEVARLAAERGKPIVLIKIGRSESGSRAARSHTAALTGSDALYEAAFRQYGVTRVNDYDELLEVSQLLAHTRKPVKPGIAVISHSGGISSLTADLCGQSGIDLPPLTDRARDGINAVLKDFGWAANPADVTGFARGENFKTFIDHLIAEPEVGTLVVASSGTGDQVDHLLALRERTEKNIVYFWTGARAEKGSLDRLKAANFPLFYSPEKLAQGLRSVLDYHAWRDRRAAAGTAMLPAMNAAQQAALKQLQASGGAAFSEADSKQVIAAWGIPGPREEPASSIDAAVAAARRIGFPVALKVDSPDILHKTEAGVVRLNLRDEAELRRAHDEVLGNAKKKAPKAAVKGVLVQEMVTGGVEVIVGVSYDPQIGPVLLCGIGGVTVEIYGDVARRRCPITRAEALEMVDEVKGAKLLRGFRGRPPADVDALADALVRVSHLAVHLEGQLAELDINPLMVLPKGQGVKAADALVVLRR